MVDHLDIDSEANDNRLILPQHVGQDDEEEEEEEDERAMIIGSTQSLHSNRSLSLSLHDSGGAGTKDDHDHDHDHNDNMSKDSGSGGGEGDGATLEIHTTTEQPAKSTPLPWRKLSGPYVLLICEAIGSTSLYSYIGFMILHFGITTDQTKVGYYAGFIASSFSLAQFLSSFFWGKMSDHYGRKPILLIGSTGSIISVLAVGLSANLPMLILARTINGVLNGNIGVVKTYIGEITDKTNQIEAFGYIGLTWGFGSIIGPMLGGVLSEPAKNMPALFGNNVFFGKMFPFLLPNLLIAVLTSIGLVFVYFFMNETLRPASGTIIARSEPAFNTNMVGEEVEGEGEGTDHSRSTIELELIPQERSINNQNDRLGAVIVGDDSRDEMDHDDLHASLRSNGQRMKDGFTALSGKLIFWKKGDGPSRGTTDATIQTRKRFKLPIDTNLFKDKQIMETTILYSIVGMIFTMYDEAFPIWAIAPKDEGGLTFQSRDTGICGAIGGATVILIQLFVIKPIGRKYGIIKAFRLGCLTAALSFLTIPILNYVVPQVTDPVTSHWVLFWTVTTLFLAFRNLAGQLVFTPVMTLINNAATSRKKGAANGLGQSMVALCRAIAPTVASVAVAWSLTPGHPFPINEWFIFLIMSLLCLPPAIYTWYLPTSLNQPIDETGEESLLHTAMLME
ncbi:hypothetical protein SAMD00019534_124500 [Acytostelium subglobosum LB1]|uniref:hypothetical protein n=1 Tax=Acytostelium subglobosum LB1 TaxID=1410327 RepID=UPI0006448022|nr:hypothetical protein SAMD00019534_124500 [Acytostelium subglobosum LB1]GAM29274.1 hypothetical protein SAMD00019534_124500 [Acytostelium subglobosum LB1]|eukprot:XP_012747772.1 hypothetical protein SAMD00019534_124500 [Acytostelium subglobosum LB1]